MHDAWENALFVHWPVSPERLAEMLPRPRLERFEKSSIKV